MSGAMTPERLKKLRESDLLDDEVEELFKEIERLQAPLPEDLEKQVGEVEELLSIHAYGLKKLTSPGAVFEQLSRLTTTVRALQAELTKERERADRFEKLDIDSRKSVKEGPWRKS